VKEAIDIMHVITIYLDESYSSEVVRKEAKPLIDVFNSISDNYNAIYLFDNLNDDYVATIRIGLDVRGIIEYTDDADYINKVYDLSDMLTLEREAIESEIYKFHDSTELEFGKDCFFIRNIGFGSSNKPLKEYE
jgi:hypothetical protein